MKLSSSILCGAVAIVTALTSCTGKSTDNSGKSNGNTINGELAAILDKYFNPVDTIIVTPDVIVSTDILYSDNLRTGNRIILVTDKTTSVTDTTVIKGSFYKISSNNPDKIQISFGVDTATYALSDLPSMINPLEQIMIPNTKLVAINEKYNFSKTDSDFDSTSYFIAEVYVSNNAKSDLTPFLTRSLQASLQDMFSGIVMDTISPGMNLYQASDFLSKQFEKACLVEPEDDEITPNYLYDALYYPDWQSADGNLVTYHLSNQYFVGEQGIDFGIYLTFDMKHNKVLGVDDIFTPSGFEKAIELLDNQVSDYAADTDGYTCSAGLSEEWISYSQGPNYYVKYNGFFYPRPALTPNGVAFAYISGEIANFMEGVHYFLIPYSKLKGAIKQDIK